MPLVMNEKVYAHPVDNETEKMRVAISRIAPSENKIAIKMLSRFYTGRAEELVIWRFKNGDTLKKEYKCGEFSKDPNIEVILESCEVRKEKWYFDFNQGKEVWLKVPKKILQRNYQTKLNVQTAFTNFEQNLIRRYEVSYGDCFDSPWYRNGVECVREVVHRIDGIFEKYAPYRAGVEEPGIWDIDGVNNWKTHKDQPESERRDKVEIERFELFSGEVELKYYDDETVKNREKIFEGEADGGMVKNTETEEVDLEGKGGGAKIDEIKMFWTKDTRWEVMNKKAKITEIFSRKISDEMRSGGRILVNVGEKMQENYTGVVYLLAKMTDGREILQRFETKECISLSDFGREGYTVCKKYLQYGFKPNYGILGHEELKYDLQRGEDWEISEADMAGIDYKKELERLKLIELEIYEREKVLKENEKNSETAKEELKNLAENKEKLKEEIKKLENDLRKQKNKAEKAKNLENNKVTNSTKKMEKVKKDGEKNEETEKNVKNNAAKAVKTTNSIKTRAAAKTVAVKKVEKTEQKNGAKAVKNDKNIDEKEEDAQKITPVPLTGAKQGNNTQKIITVVFGFTGVILGFVAGFFASKSLKLK